MNFKDKLWRYATTFIVLFIILNPEIAELALFIDVIGLEMFLMLLEVQVIAIFSVFFNSNIKPAYIYTKKLFQRYLPINSWRNIKEIPESLILAVPSPVTLMNALVILAAIGIIFNVH